jgi:hypothetical protein
MKKSNGGVASWRKGIRIVKMFTTDGGVNTQKLRFRQRLTAVLLACDRRATMTAFSDPLLVI